MKAALLKLGFGVLGFHGICVTIRKPTMKGLFNSTLRL